MERPPILVGIEPTIEVFQKAMGGDIARASYLEGLLKRANLGNSTAAISTWSMALFLIQCFYSMKLSPALCLKTDQGEVTPVSEEAARVWVTEVLLRWDKYDPKARLSP